MKTTTTTLDKIRKRGPFSFLQVRVSIARSVATLILHNGDGLACGLQFDPPASLSTNDPQAREFLLEDLRRDALDFCNKHELLVRSVVEVKTIDLDAKN